MKRQPWFTSSAGSGDLSLTIKSLLLGVIPILVTVAKMNGYEIAENDIVQLVDNVFAVIAIIGVIIGLGRKVWVAIRG